MSYNAEHQSIVPENELHSFITRIMEKVGATTAHAQTVADVLAEADKRGHYSHGILRLAYYLPDVKKRHIDVDKEPLILNQTASTALVDGNNCLGHVVGKFSMDIAIEKAKSEGIGWVCARRSNHFGIAAWYGLRAMEHGLVGMAFCNTAPGMVPVRAKERTLGTNPLCVAAKGKDGDQFVLDMATTSVAQGKVLVKSEMGEDIPLGWGVDRNGQPCTDPEEVMKKGGLTPLGGSEETGGYKGYGLAMMVELFCGILSGSRFGKGARPWYSRDTEADLAQCYVAINPQMFAPGFEERLSELIHQCKDQDSIEGEDDILIPGDPEQRRIDLCVKLGGVPFHYKQLASADKLAEEYSVEPLKRFS